MAHIDALSLNSLLVILVIEESDAELMSRHKRTQE